MNESEQRRELGEEEEEEEEEQQQQTAQQQEQSGRLASVVTVSSHWTLVLVFLVGAVLLLVSVWVLAQHEVLRTVVRELGAILIAVAAAGFIVEVLGWKRLLQDLFVPMLLDPEYVTRITLDPTVLKTRIHTLIKALHRGVKLPQALYDSLDKDMLEKIALPFRKNQLLQLTLEADPKNPNALWLEYQLTYRSANYSRESQELFRGGYFMRWVLRMLPGFTQQTLFVPEWLKIDGVPVQMGEVVWKDNETGKTLAPNEYTDEREALVLCPTPANGQLSPSESKTVSYRFRMGVRPTDYIVITTSRITSDFTVLVEYDPAAIGRLEAETGVPFDWRPADLEKTSSPGHLALYVRRYMFPGNSIYIMWHSKP